MTQNKTRTSLHKKPKKVKRERKSHPSAMYGSLRKTGRTGSTSIETDFIERVKPKRKPKKKLSKITILGKRPTPKK